MSMEPAAGAVVATRYRLERLLGEGGMGAVWSATHLVTHKPVAIKFLKAAAQGDSTTRRFLREARAASAVRHPNVVQVHDVLEHEGQPLMVMDLLTGESLASRLAREEKLPLDEFARIMLPIVSAIGTAHAAGIVHRDIKPDNVFLHQRPDSEVEPKVLDFGIAKLSAPEGAAAATAHLTSTGAVMGTPYYMAPEQVFGEKDLDQRADIWAIGVVAYECLTGKRPFDGDNVGQLFKAVVQGKVTPLEDVAPHLPKELTDDIGRMLKKDRAERASDLRELYGILKRYSSVEALSFGSAKQVALERSSEVAVITPALQRTEAIELPMAKRRWLPIAAAGALGALALGAWALLSPTNASSIEPSASASAAPIATPSAPATATSTPAPAPAPIVDAGSPVAPTPTAVAGPVRTRQPPPKPPPETTTSAAPPPSTAPSRLPGSVVEKPPF